MATAELCQALRAQGIHDERVLAAIGSLARWEFVPEDVRYAASEDAPLPIGHGQTISQPYVVAFMSQALALQPHERVLEIGTGSGYQTAVLAQLCREVYSVEILPALHARARALLTRLGLTHVHLRLADGFQGWPEAAPFDAVILTAAPPQLPPPLLAQLRPGGRLIAPVGSPEGSQVLVRVEKTPEGSGRAEELLPVRFVPMTGEAQAPPD